VKDQITRREQLKRLHLLTNQALRQAKIENIDKLNKTLVERERALAILWDFDPDKGLPEYSPDSKHARKLELNAEDEALAAEIRDLDRQLLVVLSHNMKKLNNQKRRLNDGGKYMKDVRGLYRTTSKSRYLDHVG